MMLIAHAGHWALTLLQATPLFAVLGVLAWRSVRDRRGAKHRASLHTG